MRMLLCKRKSRSEVQGLAFQSMSMSMYKSMSVYKAYEYVSACVQSMYAGMSMYKRKSVYV